MAMTSIVVGIDDSETSYRALAMAVGLATRELCGIHACFVAHVPATVAIGGLFGPMPPLIIGTESNGQLARFVTDELARAQVQGDFTRRSGEIAAELEQLAESCGADLVVVGRSTHPHLHLGGVPRRLLARGRRPVLVVP